MENEPIKVLSKSKFFIFVSIFLLFLLIDTLFGLKIIVKFQENWYETWSGYFAVILFTILMVGFFNSYISRIYLYADHISIRTLFIKRKIYLSDLTELNFASAGPGGNYYFALYGSEKTLGIINLQYLGKGDKQKEFIDYILQYQPNVQLTKNCEHLLKQLRKNNYDVN